MNEYDSNRIIDLLSFANYSKVSKLDDAQCFIFNTCNIREKANQKVYSDVGKIRKKFRDKKAKPIIVLAGCVAQAESNLVFEKSNYVDIVVGPQSYHTLPDLLNNFQSQKKKSINNEFNVIEKFDKLNQIKRNSNKVSNYITIQEGCDKFCKFCVVPYTRGPEYSRSVYEIVEEAKRLESLGTKEIILLGQNVSAYKHENNNLSDLIKEISKLNRIERIRFTTSHPNDFNDDIINIFKDEPKLMPQLHLPVQSGSDKILKLMNRNYTKKKYLNLIDKLLKAKPDIQFSSDFIVGFPEETNEDFKETLDLVKDVNFTNSYSFIYSERPGTPAVNFEKIPLSVAKDRLKSLQDLLNNIQSKASSRSIDKDNLVLFENKTRDKKQFYGKNIYAQPVFVKNQGINDGDLKFVKITDYNKNTLFGTIKD